MGLVAIAAGAMSGGGRGELLNVTALALGDDLTRMRLMAPLAVLMSSTGVTAFGAVAAFAGAAEYVGLVRQTTMAVLTGDVTSPCRGQCQLLLMAALTYIMLRQTEFEVMGRMTLLAGDPLVKPVVSGGLMTAAATPRDHALLSGSGMRVVAGQTGGSRNTLRVIGVDVPVTLGAGGRRRGLHVMRRVAVGADCVRRNRGLSQHDDGGVTRTTGYGSTGFEVVRPMATDALPVPASEERCSWDQRLHFAVAFAARSKRR